MTAMSVSAVASKHMYPRSPADHASRNGPHAGEQGWVFTKRHGCMLFVAFQTRPIDGGYRFAIPAVLEVSGCPHTSQSFVAQPTDGARRATFRPRLPGLRGLTVARAFSTECQKETDVAPSTKEPRTGQQCKHSVREHQNSLAQHASSPAALFIDSKSLHTPEETRTENVPHTTTGVASITVASDERRNPLPPSSSPSRPS